MNNILIPAENGFIEKAALYALFVLLMLLLGWLLGIWLVIVSAILFFGSDRLSPEAYDSIGNFMNWDPTPESMEMSLWNYGLFGFIYSLCMSPLLLGDLIGILWPNSPYKKFIFDPKWVSQPAFPSLREDVRKTESLRQAQDQLRGLKQSLEEEGRSSWQMDTNRYQDLQNQIAEAEREVAERERDLF